MGGVALLLPLLLLLPRSARGAAVCGTCPGPPRNGSIVSRFCESRRDTESDGRCCRERGPSPGRLLGYGGNGDYDGDRGRLVLSSVPSAVPPVLECPGGSDAWQEVTVDGSGRRCQGQRNPCNGSMELAWPCPENSVCAPDGPGLVQCLCESPFHGYKCLREGTFPVLLFGGILGTATVSVSLLLWGTQRRKAKTL
ncbi:all-trans retinoic acid-induced differentiation factor [Empidonax traillii]|uniref:all-trans retinoic acid-induced differentiation factor n=1 Tax=Empidonax traillii TaxID=164674 RepID=UPI000FFD57F4|nr:all-trans retinoic acid-induced differentiation factor [Empidonax traillii]